MIFHASGACGAGVIQTGVRTGFFGNGVDKDQSGSDRNMFWCSMVRGLIQLHI